MLVVMLSGYAGSGKDTAGKIFEEYGFQRFAFADIMKQQVGKAYSIDESLLHSQMCKQKIRINDKSLRDIIISYAMEKREIDSNCWVKLLIKQITKVSITKYIVITDFRFENEYNLILDKFKNIITIKIDRYDTNDIEHISETGLSSFKYDYVITNRSTIEEFKTNMKSLAINIISM